MLKSFFEFLAHHPRLRVLMIISIVGIAIIIGISLFSKSSDTYLSSSASDATISPDQKAQTPDPKYQKLLNQANQQQLQQANQSQQSYIEDIFSNDNNQSTVDNTKIESPKSFYQHTAQNDAHNSGNIGDSGLTFSGSDSQQAQQENLKALIHAWNQVPALQVVDGSGTNSSGANANGDTSVLFKAGEILFAVINTETNSDQPNTPILATVVTGKYKGAKLLGSFQRQDDKLVVKFNRLSLASLPSSIAVDAYAIDQNTAQSALATDVDNHYLLRYGSLFSSAFLQGFGTYFASSANNYTCPANATICINTQQTKLTTQNAVYSGLGQIGTALSSAMANQFNRPPTVTLAQGTGVGILFMNDVSASSVSMNSDNN